MNETLSSIFQVVTQNTNFYLIFQVCLDTLQKLQKSSVQRVLMIEAKLTKMTKMTVNRKFKPCTFPSHPISPTPTNKSGLVLGFKLTTK